jgi:plastocyanin
MSRSVVHMTGIAVVFGSFVAALGCDYKSPTAPPSAGSSSTPGPEGAVISIGSSGLSPNTVMITAGQSVTFVNTDSVAHQITSGPVPSYDQCPAINRVGTLEPGQRMQTGALTSSNACSFLDLMRISDSRWQGTIAVQ